MGMSARGGEYAAAVTTDTRVGQIQMATSTAGARRALLRAHRSEVEAGSEAARRALNFVLALLALIIAAPLFVIIALLVKISSPGPVFYVQARVGIDRRRRDVYDKDGRRRVDYGGKLFTIYKFRTMTVESSTAGQVWAKPDDPRVTRIGRFLRNYRLDELPQLFNVLKGDMNIVGPRPEQPKIFVDLRQQIERYPDRQRVLPGITGWAQVNQHYDLSLDDVRNKLQFDLEYIEQRRSVGGDVVILLRTVPAVLFKRHGW